MGVECRYRKGGIFMVAEIGDVRITDEIVAHLIKNSSPSR